MQHLSDYDLVSGVLRRDGKCEEALYRRYQMRMFGVCLRYACDRQEAEDMLQEGFIRVFADLRDFRFEGSLEGWVRRVVVRVALRFLKRKRAFIPLEPHGADWEAELPDEDVISSLDSYGKAMDLMGQLPPGYRTVLNLYAVEGYAHEEIAGLLGISVGTSKSQLFKARQMLRGLLEKALQKESV